MKTIVSALPKGFDSVEEAQSARRSVPSLLQRSETAMKEDKGSSSELIKDNDEAVEEMLSTSPNSLPFLESKLPTFAYKWRANLLATESYWAGWFQGLSQSFLSVKCARLLLLAGTDRLDKDLMIGQMQGRYQLVVFADVGHSLQEDAPQRTAQTLIDFWKRNESLDLTNIRGGLRKVGQA